MVSSSEGMFDGVHSNTSNLRPAVTLNLVFVVGATSLQERLVDTSTSSNNTNGGTASGVQNLLGSRWELDTGLSGIGVVGNDDSGVSGGLGEFSAVSVFHLDAAAGSSFGHVSDGENVSDVESGLFTTIDSLARGGTLSSNEKLLVLSELVGILEGDLGERSSSAGVVDDVLDDTFDEAVSFSKVH